MLIKRMKYAVLGIAVLTAISGSAFAADQQVDADIAFDAALSLTLNSNIDFGIVRANRSGTYSINTAGTVTPSNGGEVIGGTPVVGDITISGSATQTIDISAGSYTADNGVTPSSAVCKYGAGAEQACNYNGAAAPGAAGTTLLVGVTVAADGSQDAGETATPSFTITVVYG